jgi:hypothetical protein
LLFIKRNKRMRISSRRCYTKPRGQSDAGKVGKDKEVGSLLETTEGAILLILGIML